MHTINRQLIAVTGWLLFATLLAALVTAPVNAAPDFPALTGRVVDRANLLDAATEAELDAQLAEHETATSNQMVVATVSGLQGYDISDFANQLGRHWAIGQADKDNGIVLLVAPNERKVRIEVGYGLEGALTDVISADIIRRQILPQFRENDYPAGIRMGVNSIISAIDGEYTVEPGRKSGRDNVAKSHFPLFFMAIIALFEILKRFGFRKLGNTAFPTALFGIAATAVTNNILIGIVAAIAVFLMAFFLGKPGQGGGSGHSHHNQRADRDNENRGSSMGSGGGFGGGGGSFGGGGASGGW